MNRSLTIVWRFVASIEDQKVNKNKNDNWNVKQQSERFASAQLVQRERVSGGSLSLITRQSSYDTVQQCFARRFHASVTLLTWTSISNIVGIQTRRHTVARNGRRIQWLVRERCGAVGPFVQVRESIVDLKWCKTILIHRLAHEFNPSFAVAIFRSMLATHQIES